MPPTHTMVPVRHTRLRDTMVPRGHPYPTHPPLPPLPMGHIRHDRPKCPRDNVRHVRFVRLTSLVRFGNPRGFRGHGDGFP